MIMWRIFLAIRYRLRSFGKHLVTYVELQLFLSLCAWPILAAWGLPLSPAGLLGNFLYGPFLSAFLFLSSLLFVCELISIPHYPLCILLEALTHIWTSILSYADRSWLYLAAHPGQKTTLILPLLAFLTMLFKPFTSPAHRIGSFLILFIGAGYLIPYAMAYKEKRLTIPFCKGELTLIRSSSNTLLIDHGIFGRTMSAPKNIEFQVVPFLIKHGIRHLDNVIIARPSARVFATAAKLIELFPIDTVYIPQWNGTLSNQGWWSWQQLITHAKTYTTELKYLTTSQLMKCGSSILSISVAEKPIKKNHMVYKKIDLAILPSTPT